MKKHYHPSLLFPLILVTYEMFCYLSNDMYLPALPDMMRDLSLTTTQAQLTITMWFIGSAITPLVIGALADRFGRRCVLLIGGIFYVLSSVVCALAVNEYTLLLPRVVQGAMVASMMVAGYACIHELYDHKEAIRILAIMGSISTLAPALGPMAGAVVLLIADWRWIFWLIAIISTILLILLYHYMPETLPIEKREPLHLRKIARHAWTVVNNRSFILLTCILNLGFVGFIGWIAAGPLLVIDSLQYSAIAFGWMQAIIFGAFIIGSHYVNFMMEKVSANRLITVGVTLSTVSGIATWVFASIWPNHFYWFLAAMTIFSFGFAVMFAPLHRLVIETSTQPMGIRVAVFTTALMLAGTIGSAINSVIYNGTAASLASVIAIGMVLACILHITYLITIVIPSRIC